MLTYYISVYILYIYINVYVYAHARNLEKCDYQKFWTINYFLCNFKKILSLFLVYLNPSPLYITCYLKTVLSK